MWVGAPERLVWAGKFTSTPAGGISRPPNPESYQNSWSSTLKKWDFFWGLDGGVLPFSPKGSILALKWTGPVSGHFLPKHLFELWTPVSRIYRIKEMFFSWYTLDSLFRRPPVPRPPDLCWDCLCRPPAREHNGSGQSTAASENKVDWLWHGI